MTYRLFIREPNFKELRPNLVLTCDGEIVGDVPWAQYEDGTISYVVDGDDESPYYVPGELVIVPVDGKLPGEA